MNGCLWCGSDILFEADWTNLFWPPVPQQICVACDMKLERLDGSLCKSCGGKTSKDQCADCIRWAKHESYHDVLTFNRSVFFYNETMQEMITKWKYRGDYLLWQLFEQPFKEAFQVHFSFLKKQAVLVPIPLSQKRLNERAFNQAEALAQAINMPAVSALLRTEGEKQSKKRRRERMVSVNPFSLNKTVTTPVILIDDIYTTGTTLRHAAAVLKRGGCPAVYALTLARG